MALSPSEVEAASACRVDKSTLSNHEFFCYRHLSLDVSVDFDRTVLCGTAKWTLDVADSPTLPEEIVLDTSAGLEVLSVTVCSARVEHTMRPEHKAFGTACAIPLAPELRKAGKELTVEVAYSTSPASSALQWLPAEQTADKRHPFLFSQCQAIHARAMVPCPDAPAAKFTYDASVRVPAWATALMSAVPAESKGEADQDTRVFKFEQKNPLCSYLLAIAVGELEGKEVGPRSTVYAEPSVVEAAAYEFVDCEKFVSTAEELTGTPYIWGRYDVLCMPPSFPYGGMENPCLTFATPTLLAGDRSLAGVICHEVAHSWTGNLVTNHTWEHFWLNEGWTRWLENRVLSRLQPEGKREAYYDFEMQQSLTHLAETVAEFGAESPMTRLVPPLDGIDPDDSFSAVPYEKGLALLNHIADVMGGREVFEEFAKHYVSTFKSVTLTSADFKRCVLEWCKTKGIDASVVDWTAWFGAPGMPPVTLKFSDEMGAACTRLADKWFAEHAAMEGDASLSADEYQAWPSPLRIYFLEILLSRTLKADEPPLSSASIKRMDQLYGLTATRNAEIRCRWQRICIMHRQEFIVPKVLEFVKEQGRMKFVRTLYRALYAWEAHREVTVETFKSWRHNYHPIAAKMLAQDLKVAA